ncbi:hypothetical protein [Gordonia sp. NB41Y]|uniref:hypothetical protein n=1 Tax=Gordonia sp. NB41Y TaxID=875808 RepID=UPI0006B18605|nr:hypothetical protein [Gordonia sp. NB41Y]EMP15064.2 hypothetical protein ISGA_26 [Gordonia sp. NB41Y]WLP91323.1 hypothetical protein Q9K23_03365 [Gordonia sp. NB41Y]
MTTPVSLVTPQLVCTTTALPLPAADSAELAQLEVLCERAAGVIRSRVVAVDARITAGSLQMSLVQGVATDMVIAALENLDLGFRNTGEQYPEIHTTNVAAGNRLTVEMTAAQLDQLAPPSPTAGVYNVPLG